MRNNNIQLSHVRVKNKVIAQTENNEQEMLQELHLLENQKKD